MFSAAGMSSAPKPFLPSLAPSVRTTALHTHRSLASCTQTTPMSGPTRPEALLASARGRRLAKAFGCLGP